MQRKFKNLIYRNGIKLLNEINFLSVKTYRSKKCYLAWVINVAVKPITINCISIFVVDFSSPKLDKFRKCFQTDCVEKNIIPVFLGKKLKKTPKMLSEYKRFLNKQAKGFVGNILATKNDKILYLQRKRKKLNINFINVLSKMLTKTKFFIK